jgi:hypothetical protein
LTKRYERLIVRVGLIDGQGGPHTGRPEGEPLRVQAVQDLLRDQAEEPPAGLPQESQDT